MTHVFCLLNHELTQNQLTELQRDFGVLSDCIIYPSKELSAIWAQIPPEKNSENIVVQHVIEWLSSASANDVLIVQGAFGATFTVVDYALSHSIIPLYAVTKRVATESRNGEIIKRQYIFEHICFHRYKYFS